MQHIKYCDIPQYLMCCINQIRKYTDDVVVLSVAILLILIVLGWAFYNIMHLGRASEAILKKNYNSILAAENMIASIERQDPSALLLLLGYQSEGQTQFSEMEAKFLQWFSRAKDNITEKGEREIVEAIEGAFTLYLEKFAQLRLLSGSEKA